HRALHSFPTRRSSDLAAEHETLHFLGFFPGLELAGDFRLAQFTRQLWVAKRGDQALTYFIILVTAIQAAEPDFAVFVRAVIQVQDRKSTRLNSSHVKI